MLWANPLQKNLRLMRRLIVIIIIIIISSSSRSSSISIAMIQSIIMTKKTLLPQPESLQTRKHATPGHVPQNFISWSICLAQQLPLAG
jgi:hypothetical protein